MVGRETGVGEEVLEELAGQRRPDEEGGLWRNLRLDWVRNWDEGCQTTVLLSRLQHTGKRTQHNFGFKCLNSARFDVITPEVLCLCDFGYLELDSCDPAVLWRYLTALHDQARVVGWIQDQETANVSRWPELAPELVHDNTLCSTYMREDVLDLLARYSRRSHHRRRPFFHRC